jgi:hypothetical protein
LPRSAGFADTRQWTSIPTFGFSRAFRRRRSKNSLPGMAHEVPSLSRCRRSGHHGGPGNPKFEARKNWENPKSEARNPKQIRNPKREENTGSQSGNIWFRILDFEF